MPGIKTHCAQALVSGAALAPLCGPANAAVFGLSIVLIDIDHVLEYMRQTRSLKPWGVFPCCRIIETNLHRGFYVFNAFHTLEVLLAICLAGLLSPVFFYIAAGMLWHCALDLLMLGRNNLAGRRALSVAEYVIRSRNPDNIIRFDELLRLKDVAIPDRTWDYPAWLRHWRSCRKPH